MESKARDTLSITQSLQNGVHGAGYDGRPQVDMCRGLFMTRDMPGSASTRKGCSKNKDKKTDGTSDGAGEIR